MEARYGAHQPHQPPPPPPPPPPPEKPLPPEPPEKLLPPEPDHDDDDVDTGGVVAKPPIAYPVAKAAKLVLPSVGAISVGVVAYRVPSSCCQRSSTPQMMAYGSRRSCSFT